MPPTPGPPSLGPPLLATKVFLPRPRQALVARPRLLQLLDAAHTHPLTLVAAPAGFGKTTLVAAWAQQQPWPVAWLALDAADNDPQRFLRYLLAALQTLDRGGVAQGIGRDLCQALESGQTPPLEAAMIMLLNDLAALPHDVLLVLDDFHLIEEPRIEEALGVLVAHQPPQFHLLIATREDPPLPLARLRGRGLLAEVRAQDLRFTPDEAQAFLHEVMGLDLTPQQMADLDARIEGWVAGLQLAGLSLQRSDDPARLIAGLSSNHHFILTYLTEEVLRRQAPTVQEFLLQTAILAQLSAPLCDAVCARTDSDARLEALYAGNALIIPLDAEHASFRYHHLFRELLRGQLQRTAPQQIPALHRRAAAWHEAHGQPSEAIEHTLAAEDYAHAVTLLEAHARPLVLGGYAQTIALWLHRLPPVWQAAGPHANVAFAWSLLLRGQLEAIDGYLGNAEAAMGSMLDRPASERQGLEAEILALRAALVSLRGDPEMACDMARAAVALAPADHLYVQGATRFCLATALNYAGRTVEAIAAYQEALPPCRAAGNAVAAMLSVANLAMLTIERGELHAAAALCRRVIAEAEAARALPSPMLASVYGALAHALYEWNELDEALHLAQRALALAQRSGHIAAVAYGSVVLSRIEAARGNFQDAEQFVEQAQQLRGRAMPAWVTPYIVAQQVELALAREDTAAAAAVLAASGVAADAPTGHTREVIHLAHLRLLLHQLPGQTARPALELASRILASAEAGGRLGRVIEALAVRAIVCAGLPGKHAQARADLQRALELGAASGYVRLFAGLHRDMARLIAEFEPPGGLAAYVTDLRTVLAAEVGTKTPPTQELVEPLSDREIEVLQLLAQGLTYQEAAERLIVSVNTVRFHVKSIYGKLGAENRTAALETARKLSIL